MEMSLSSSSRPPTPVFIAGRLKISSPRKLQPRRHATPFASSRRLTAFLLQGPSTADLQQAANETAPVASALEEEDLPIAANQPTASVASVGEAIQARVTPAAEIAQISAARQEAWTARERDLLACHSGQLWEIMRTEEGGVIGEGGCARVKKGWQYRCGIARNELPAEEELVAIKVETAIILLIVPLRMRSCLSLYHCV